MADPEGWLVVVTSRLCLDQIRSARARRERPHDPLTADLSAPLPEHGPLAGDPGVDPADRITLDDSVRLALLVVLERLSPAERVVFVLHDIFSTPFDAVAETIGKSPAACRQLARRARQKIEDGEGRFAVAPPEHRRVTERFIAACAAGSIEQLLDVLDPGVWGAINLLPGLVRVGALVVAPTLVRFWSQATLVSTALGPECPVLAFVDRQLLGVMFFAISEDRISSIRIVADPAVLGILGAELASQAGDPSGATGSTVP